MSFNDHTNWQPWQSSEAEPWDLRRVWHLHRRAGFAATWAEMQRDLRDGIETSVSRVLDGEARVDGVPDEFAAMADTIGRAAVSAGNIERLKAWWVYRMLFSPDPLSERLALMWHNHFATSNLKVDDVALMRQQNELFRQHGRGSFGELLKAVVKDPVVLVWLDADANRKEHPNENLARELMELFTLGVGHFTEQDVKEAARCLTGWTVSRGKFRYVNEYHDEGEKTVLGQTSRFDGNALLTLLVSQPATAQRLAWRLCHTFLGENVVSSADIDALAEGLRHHELDIGWGLETILRSKLFFSAGNFGTQIMSPAEFVVGTARALELLESPPSTLLLAEQMGRMGQDLFMPPNVFGWKEGRTWINTRSLIGRANYTHALIAGELQTPVKPIDALQLTNRRREPRDESDEQSQEEPVVDFDAVTSFFSLLLWGKDVDAEFQQQIQETCDGPDTETAARMIVEVLLTSPQAQLS